VTLGSGIVDASTAAIQDPTGAIALRLGDKAGSLRRGTLVDVLGVRSTKSGMLTIRVDKPPVAVGRAAEPTASLIATGGAGEPLEARLVTVRGMVTSAPIRSTAGNLAFTVDDGSGPLRVTIFVTSEIRSPGLVKGALAEVRGVLGQQTTGQQPDRGYRLWPRDAADLVVHAPGGPSSGSVGVTHAASAGGLSVAGHNPVGVSRLPRLVDDVGSSPSSAPGNQARGAAEETQGAGLQLGSGPSAGGGVEASKDAIGVPAKAGLIQPMALHALSSKYASALLVSAVALLMLLGTLAWRTGALGRLRLAMERLVDREAGEAPSVLEPAGEWGTMRNGAGDRLP